MQYRVNFVIFRHMGFSISTSSGDITGVNKYVCWKEEHIEQKSENQLYIFINNTRYVAFVSVFLDMPTYLK